jgi:transcriptional regulator with XRE-family HTH domain
VTYNFDGLIDNRDVGFRLFLWRESRRAPKLRIAKALQISHQRWHHYETGRSELDIETACKLCVIDKRLTLDWLYRGTPMKPALRKALTATRRRIGADSSA